MNVKNILPDPKKFKGVRNWWAWTFALVLSGALTFTVAKWHHETLVALGEFFGWGATPTKVVRLVNEDEEAISNVVISDGKHIWEQNGLNDISIENSYRGKTVTIHQVQPQEPIATFVINFEPIQRIRITNRYIKVLDDYGDPLPGLVLRMTNGTTMQFDENGMIKVDHLYCNQFIDVFCSRCKKVLAKKRLSHQKDDQTIVIPRNQALLSPGDKALQLKVRGPDGITSTVQSDKNPTVPCDWCGKTIEVWLPSRPEPFRLLVKHNEPLDLNQIVNHYKTADQ